MEEYEPQASDQPAVDSPEDDGTSLSNDLADPTEAVFVSAESSPARNTGIMLGTLVIIGAAIIGFMRMRSGPAAATASPPEAVSAHATISQFLAGGRGAKATADLLSNTEKLRQAFLNYPTMAQVSLEELRTNPFLFCKSAAKNDDELLKKKEAEELRKGKEQEKQAVMAALGQLKLQSIIHSGATRTCMISSKACMEGQEVDGFVIEKISPGGVIVKKAGYRFELRMQK